MSRKNIGLRVRLCLEMFIGFSAVTGILALICLERRAVEAEVVPIDLLFVSGLLVWDKLVHMSLIAWGSLIVISVFVGVFGELPQQENDATPS